ncbi:MAG: hypothetical protein OHK0022_36560 [Roseiflexaceae bacterium]
MPVYETTTTRLNQQELGSCALIQDLLPLYIEGEVSPSSRDLIVEHLARCERCAGFMAGAQTTMAQLRRETALQVHVVQRDAPVQQKVKAGQWLLKLIATFTICVIGGLSALLIFAGVGTSTPGMSMVGLLAGLACFGALAAIAHNSIRMTMLRWFGLSTSCIIGVIGSALVALSRGEPLGVLTMLVLWLMGYAGVWLALREG